MRLWLSIPAGALVLTLFELPSVSWGVPVASLLTASALALVIARSRVSGPGLIVMLAGLLFVVTWLVNIPEGVLFDVIEPTAAPVALVRSLAASVVTGTVMVVTAGRTRPQWAPATSEPVETIRGLLWRLAATPAVFIVLYFAAGLIIYPFVREYYAGRTMPDLTALLSMQVLRSLAMVGAAYPVLRSMPTRRDAVVALAIALPVLGSLAPLIPANELMPGPVRLVHALETVPYYALFGALVALWFGPQRDRSRRTTAPVAATAWWRTRSPVHEPGGDRRPRERRQGVGRGIPLTPPGPRRDVGHPPSRVHPRDPGRPGHLRHRDRRPEDPVEERGRDGEGLLLPIGPLRVRQAGGPGPRPRRGPR